MTDIAAQPTESDPTDQGMSLADFAADMSARAKAAGGPAKVYEGAFAMYAEADGGATIVLNVPDGEMAGVRYIRIRPGMIRAISALGGGQSISRSVMAALGRGRKDK